MGKKLISPTNLNQYISEGQKEILIDKTMIISPGAKDLLEEQGITIIYDDISKDQSREKDLLKEKIKDILIREFKINDQKTVEDLITKVYEKIKY
ncbi:hypothetical protein KQI42_14525 [Tissierella sp. MSJ-40]|uniref:Uncharacterized protein n=1 Tax=Tissierella simiarum TaxID=2841534 RepID=A0ABS6E8I1_9FIRM|nr:hypothetical protein [Tissierella simiarum]MBU5439235.1 hypothetical protein [Tissierella simiarum]